MIRCNKYMIILKIIKNTLKTIKKEHVILSIFRNLSFKMTPSH